MKSPLVYHVQKAVLYPAIVAAFPKSRHFLFSQGMTFAFEERKDGWYVATSNTFYKDSFCRKIGRAIAVGRLKCKRKNLAEYFGTEPPTFEDCLTMYYLDDTIRYGSMVPANDAFFKPNNIIYTDDCIPMYTDTIEDMNDEMLLEHDEAGEWNEEEAWKLGALL